MLSRSSARVAVVTRTRNRPLLLPRAADSVSRQTFRDLVWVVVNDGGDPAPVRQAAARVRAAGFAVVECHQADSRGMEAASNRGCRAADSAYLAIHDDDDSWEPEFLAHTVAALAAEPSWAGVVTRAHRVEERLTATGWEELNREVFNPWVRAIHLVDMMQRNLFPPIALLFRRDAYDQVAGFDEALPVLGDWDFNLRLLLHRDLGFLPLTLANYHIRSSGTGGVGDGADDAYLNTVSQDPAVFARHDAALRNHWLRRELAEGRFGLGALAALGRQHLAMWEVLRGGKSLESGRSGKAGPPPGDPLAPALEPNAAALFPLPPHAQRGPRLYSMANYAFFLTPLLTALAPRALCEIGCEYGHNTRFLSTLCQALGARLVIVDPQPRIPDAFKGLLAVSAQTSRAFLAQPQDIDVYFVDGDHNYHVVRAELEGIGEQVLRRDGAERRPFILLHDVGWPCGRRDFYFDPTQVTAPHPHTYEDGTSPFRPGPVPLGIGRAGTYHKALASGGPGNGVLTAAEDFVAAHPDWRLHTTFVLNGLGMLWRDADLTPVQRATLADIHTHLDWAAPMFAILELNRFEQELALNRAAHP